MNGVNPMGFGEQAVRKRTRRPDQASWGSLGRQLPVRPDGLKGWTLEEDHYTPSALRALRARALWVAFVLDMHRSWWALSRLFGWSRHPSLRDGERR